MLELFLIHQKKKSMTRVVSMFGCVFQVDKSRRRSDGYPGGGRSLHLPYETEARAGASLVGPVSCSSSEESSAIRPSSAPISLRAWSSRRVTLYKFRNLGRGACETGMMLEPTSGLQGRRALAGLAPWLERRPPD